MAEITYYWNTIGTSNWTDFAYMRDGFIATWAYTSRGGNVTGLKTTTCPGTNLGTITRVEVRCYAYGDGNDRVDYSFGLVATTPEYQTTPDGSEGWGSWVDVAADTNVDGWTWAKVKDLYTEKNIYLIVEFDKVKGGGTMYCAKVEIRVTYTPSAGYHHGLKVRGVGELALCDVGTNPLRVRKGGTTYGIELVATDDPNASAVRMKTNAGIKAIRKYM